MKIAIPLFDGFTALDAVGPYEVLSQLPGARVSFVASAPGPKRNDTGSLALMAEHGFAEEPAPDVIVVPGSSDTRAMLEERELIGWIRAVHPRTAWTTSVCTGALLLGAAGVLTGLEATTYWLALERLREFGSRPTGRRVVVQGKVITAAGVSAGIDMALALAARLAGEEIASAIQLGIEYDPEPPFDSGSPAKARPETVALVEALVTARDHRPP